MDAEVIPALPPGFKLDAAVPPLPAGFSLDPVPSDAQASPPRNVRAARVAARSGTGALNSAIAYTQMPVVGAVNAADAIASLIFGTRRGALTEAYGDKFVVPNLTAVESAALKPGENAGAVGNALIGMAPQVGKIAGDLAVGGPLAMAAKAPLTVAKTVGGMPAVMDALRVGATSGMPSGFRVAGERQAEMVHLGVNPLVAAVAAAVSGLTTVGQFALPASAGSAAATLPGRVLSRAAQGAAINVPAGAAQTGIENAMLPAGAESMRQEVLDPTARIADLVAGTAFGQLGSRAAPFRNPNRAAMGYDRPTPNAADVVQQATVPPELSIADMIAARTGAPRNQPDPAAAAEAAVEADRARRTAQQDARAAFGPIVGREAEVYPQLADVPTNTAQVARQAAARAGDPLPEGVDVGTVQREAFDIANRRQEQADRDLRRNDQIAPDYQGDGAAATGGRGDQGMRQITLLDGQMPVMVNGVDGNRVDVTWQREDGEYERAIVDARRLTQRDVPANQRMAQDFTERSSEPRRGVGEQTMADEKMPRRSTDRIAGDQAGGRAEPYDPTIRDPREPANGARVVDREGGPVVPRQPQELGNTRRQNGRTGPEAERSGNDGNGNRQLRAPQGDAPVARTPEPSPPNGKRPADRAGTPPDAAGDRDNGQAGVAEPREVPRLQVEYAELNRQIKRQNTSVRTIEKRLADKENPPDTDEKKRLNDRLAKLKESRDLNVRKRDAIASRLTDERLPKKEVQDGGILGVLRRAGGVTPKMARDLGVDKKDPKLVNKKGIGDEDNLVWALHDKDILTDAEANSPDAYKIATEKIRRGLLGEDEAPRSEADMERLGRERSHAEAEELAREMGVDTRDMTLEQKWRAVSEAQEKALDADRIKEANAAAEAAREADMDARSIDDVLDEIGVSDADREDAKWRREGAPEANAAADEPANKGAGSVAPEAVPREPGPAQQARPDEVRDQPEPRNQPDRAGPGEGDSANVEERPASGEAGGKSAADPGIGRDDPRYRLNALPLDAAWDGIKAVLKRMVSDKTASSGLLSALKDAVGEAKNASPREFVAKTLGALLWSDASVMRTVADARKSAVLDRVWRMFSDMGGTEKIKGETFEQEVHARYNRNVNRVSDALDGLTAEQAQQVRALLENRAAIAPGRGGAHKAAAEIADILNAERAWLKSNGVEIGDTKNYFPRVYDLRAVVGKLPEFIKAAESAYRMMGVDDPRRAAEAWAHAMRMKGDAVPEVPFMEFTSGAPSKHFAKTREIPLDIAKRSGLDKFTSRDVFETLDGYLRRTAKRGAFESRFGGTDEGGANAKWREMRDAMIAEKNGDLVEWAENRILSMSGQLRTSIPQSVQGAMSVVRAVTVLTFLRRAVISSLTEPLQVGNRTAAAGAGKAIANTMKMYAHGADRLARLITGSGKSASDVERMRIAQMLGTIINERVESGVAALRFDGNTLPNEAGTALSRAGDKLTFAAMKASGLHDWTNANMADSTVIGFDFIKSMAEGVGDKKLAGYELDRLGVADHAEFAKYATRVKSADDLVADLRAGNKQAAQYVAAIDKFSRQVIMKPTAADKPVLAKHPIAQVAYGLQSWMYSYWYNVQRANIAQVIEAAKGKGYTAGERTTMAAAPVLYTAAMVAMTGGMLTGLRDLYAGRDRDKEREEKNKKAAVLGVSVETLRALSQAQIFGLADPWVNSLTSVRYNKLPGSELGGPLFGRVQRAAMSAGSLVSDKNGAGNSTERRAAEDLYNLVVDPALSLAAAAAPMPLAAGLTFASQRDELRQGTVDFLAGERVRR